MANSSRWAKWPGNAAAELELPNPPWWLLDLNTDPQHPVRYLRVPRLHKASYVPVISPPSKMSQQTSSVGTHPTSAQVMDNHCPGRCRPATAQLTPSRTASVPAHLPNPRDHSAVLRFTEHTGWPPGLTNVFITSQDLCPGVTLTPSPRPGTWLPVESRSMSRARAFSTLFFLSGDGGFLSVCWPPDTTPSALLG